MTDMPQQNEFEAVYISESFGVPLVTALKIAQAAARKKAKATGKQVAKKAKRRK